MSQGSEPYDHGSLLHEVIGGLSEGRWSRKRKLIFWNSYSHGRNKPCISSLNLTLKIWIGCGPTAKCPWSSSPSPLLLLSSYPQPCFDTSECTFDSQFPRISANFDLIICGVSWTAKIPTIHHFLEKIHVSLWNLIFTFKKTSILMEVSFPYLEKGCPLFVSQIP